MSIRVFYPNKYDKIEFSKEELEKLIKDVYNEGLSEGRLHPYSYPWYISTTSVTNATGTESNISLSKDTITQTNDNELKIVY